MNRQPPWLLIATLAVLLLFPGLTFRLVAGLAQGLLLFAFIVPLVGGLLVWLWWRNVQSKVTKCPSCATLTMNSAICPSCGYDLRSSRSSGAAAQPPDGNVIDIEVEVLDDQ